jgi:hypothetical protein
LRLEFLAEVKALMNEGLLSEAEFAQLKTINGKGGNGHDLGYQPTQIAEILPADPFSMVWRVVAF